MICSGGFWLWEGGSGYVGLWRRAAAVSGFRGLRRGVDIMICSGGFWLWEGGSGYVGLWERGRYRFIELERNFLQ
jgi:hypothetical protein